MRRKGLVLVTLAMLLCFGCQKTDNKEDKSTKEAKSSTEDGDYSPIVSDSEIDDEIEYPYEIKVNKEQNCITVYGVDDTGKYIVPVRAMICSTGGEETPTGTFQLGETSRWQMETDGEFCQYVTSIVDNVAFQSAPYYSQNNQDLNVEQFNKMGQVVSGSSIQLEVADAKWIAKNCPAGTKVEIYEEKEPGPLGKPQARILDEDAKKDPTDTAKNEKKDEDYVPVVFEGIEDRVIEVSQICDLLEGISAQDNEEQDLTASIKVFGQVDIMTPGSYEVVYMCQNDNKESRAVKCTVQVTEPQPEPEVVTEDAVQIVTPEQLQTIVEDAEEEGSVIFVNPVLIPDATPTPTPTPVPTPTPTPTPVSTPTPVPTATPVPTTSVQTNYNDIMSPAIEIVAASRYTKDVTQETLTKRVRITDDSGSVAALYITVQPLRQNSIYVIVYEAVDAAGNASCISETVEIPDPTVFR